MSTLAEHRRNLQRSASSSPATRGKTFRKNANDLWELAPPSMTGRATPRSRRKKKSLRPCTPPSWKAGARSFGGRFGTAAGIADIVTDDAVIEVKLNLTRAALFSAVGQVTVYAAELGRPRRVVFGYRVPGTEKLIDAIRLAGIEVEG
jgi:hypothetical protein